MSLSDKLNALKQVIYQTETELNLLQTGRKTAGPRARKGLQDIKNQSGLLRKEITTFTKSLPTKTRPKKDKAVAEPEPVEQVAELEPIEQVAEQPTKKKRKIKSKKVLFV